MRISCPNCQFQRDVPEEKIPSQALRATCPKCKETFQFRNIQEEKDLPPEKETKEARIETIDRNMDILITGFMDEFGLNDLPEKTRVSLTQTMKKNLSTRLVLLVLEELSENDRDEYMNVIEEEDANKTEVFLREKLNDYEGLVLSVVADFKKEMKHNITELKQQLGI
jgi:predicted Zn finger-like uncharacterized protein